MGRIDAINDKIPISKDKYGFTVFCPPCHICGAPVQTWVYQKDLKYTCRRCHGIKAVVKKFAVTLYQQRKKTKNWKLL